MTIARKRILLIEDSNDLCYVYRRYLGLHHHYEVAATAKMAIARIAAQDFDHILCDYHLDHGSNGKEVYAWIANNRPRLLEGVFVFVCAAMDKVDDLGIRIIPKGELRELQALVSPPDQSGM